MFHMITISNCSGSLILIVVNLAAKSYVVSMYMINVYKCSFLVLFITIKVNLLCVHYLNHIIFNPYLDYGALIID